jgi:hypothetical protein
LPPVQSLKNVRLHTNIQYVLEMLEAWFGIVRAVYQRSRRPLSLLGIWDRYIMVSSLSKFVIRFLLAFFMSSTGFNSLVQLGGDASVSVFSSSKYTLIIFSLDYAGWQQRYLASLLSEVITSLSLILSVLWNFHNCPRLLRFVSDTLFRSAIFSCRSSVLFSLTTLRQVSLIWPGKKSWCMWCLNDCVWLFLAHNLQSSSCIFWFVCRSNGCLFLGSLQSVVQNRYALLVYVTWFSVGEQSRFLYSRIYIYLMW